MCNKPIIRFGFCDIQNSEMQGLSKSYQPQPSASANNLYLELDYFSWISKNPHPIIVYNMPQLSYLLYHVDIGE